MKTSISAQELIVKYQLLPHPEGGFYRQTYRSSETIRQDALPVRFSGARAISTAIYYLLPKGSRSHLHRIASDEMWHFYLGGPLKLTEIYPDGKVVVTILGQDVNNGHYLQYVVPAGVWFGAEPASDSAFCFVGCTVAPGFDFLEFEIGKRTELIQQFPHARQEIEKLTSST